MHRIRALHSFLGPGGPGSSEASLGPLWVCSDSNLVAGRGRGHGCHVHEFDRLCRE